jgi:hypothetical protein
VPLEAIAVGAARGVREDRSRHAAKY